MQSSAFTPKLHLLFFFVILCVKTIEAQSFEVTESAEGKWDASPGDQIHFGTHLYAFDLKHKREVGYTAKLSRYRFGVSVQTLGQDLRVQKEILVNEGKENLGPLVPEWRILDNRLYLFCYEFYDAGSAKTVMLKAIQIDTLTQNFGKEIVLLDMSIPDYGMSKLYKLIHESKLITNTSPDGKMLLILWASAVSGDILIHVTKPDLSSIWSGTATLAGQPEIAPKSAVIDNQGFVYTGSMAHLREPDKAYFGVFRPGNRNSVSEIVMNEGSIYEVHVIQTAGRIHVAGGYARSSIGSAIGVYHIPFSGDTLDLNKMEVTPFLPGFLKGLGATKSELSYLKWFRDKKDPGLPWVEMQAMALEGGNFALIGKMTYSTLRDKYMYYYSGPVLTYIFKSTGPSFYYFDRERGGREGANGESIYVLPYGSGTFMFYNDQTGNLSKAANERSEVSDACKGCVLSAAITDANGDLTKVSVHGDKYLAVPEFIQQIAPNIFYVPFRRFDDNIPAKEMKWVRVTVRE